MCELWRGLVLYSNPLAFGHGENMSHQPLNELQAELALCHMRSDRLKCGNIQPPWQALRETPAHGFIHRQKACCETTITCPPLCVRVLRERQKTIHTGVQVTCTTEYWICWESVRRSCLSRCLSGTMLSGHNGELASSSQLEIQTSALSTGTKTSTRLSRLFPPVHPLNSIFLRLFLTQTRLSWFLHEVMHNRKHLLYIWQVQNMCCSPTGSQLP